MSTVQGRLRIAVQKSGRLADRSLDLIRDAGLKWVKGHNDLLYRVENYPIDRALIDRGGSFKLRDLRLHERTNFPLTILVLPGEELSLRAM